MTTLSSPFQIHSTSILTPTEADSSHLAILTPTDHQIVPGPPQSFPSLVEEMEENEMSTNFKILANLDSEQGLFSSLRNVDQGGVANLAPAVIRERFMSHPAGP